MAKVHPNNPAIEEAPVDGGRADDAAVAMTVWRKSLLFNCRGFAVFDAKGNLLFRVDSYSSSSRNEEIVLMNAYGKCLYTIKRKRLSLCENWLVYRGEATTSHHRFSVGKRSTFLGSEALARVTSSGCRRHTYSVEGSYSRRQCTIYDDRHRAVGEVRRKEAAAAGIALGCDVFCLTVRSEMDAALAMAMVIVLEQMYGS